MGIGTTKLPAIVCQKGSMNLENSNFEWPNFGVAYNDLWGHYTRKRRFAKKN